MRSSGGDIAVEAEQLLAASAVGHASSTSSLSRSLSLFLFLFLFLSLSLSPAPALCTCRESGGGLGDGGWWGAAGEGEGREILICTSTVRRTPSAQHPREARAPPPSHTLTYTVLNLYLRASLPRSSIRDALNRRRQLLLRLEPHYHRYV